MADLHYWRLIEVTGDDGLIASKDLLPEVTMLATGDVLADINTMQAKAEAGPWKQSLIQLLESSSHGDEPAEDGKDQYRAHTLVMTVDVVTPEILAEYP